MKSLNFEFLREQWPELASLGGFAEAYAYTDPTSSLVKLRAFAEFLTKDIYSRLALPKPNRASFIDLLAESTFCTVTPKVVLDKLHAIRMQGNKAAHGEVAKPQTSLWLLKEAHDLARWLVVNFKALEPSALSPFVQPECPKENADIAEGARDAKKSLEKLAAQEAELVDLLAALEEAQNSAIAAEKKTAELESLTRNAQSSADVLKFDEATTRTRIIDGMLASAGWEVADGLKSSASVGKEHEVGSQPTSSGQGYVDYVLWDDDGTPLAVVEAKWTCTGLVPVT